MNDFMKGPSIALPKKKPYTLIKGPDVALSKDVSIFLLEPSMYALTKSLSSKRLDLAFKPRPSRIITTRGVP